MFCILMPRFIFDAYSDGGCSPNPGVGGWGAVVMNKTKPTILQWVKYGGKKQTTNNEMELTGALEVLRLCPVGHDLTLNMDTQYFLNGVIKGGVDGYVTRSPLGKSAVFTGWVNGWMAKGWKTAGGTEVKNLELWKDIVKECETHVKGGSTLHFKWVKGHSGNEGNDLADQLATLGLNQTKPS